MKRNIKENNIFFARMKRIVFILMIIFCMSLSMALDECQDIESINHDCEILTPVIDCSTYDLYAPNHSLMINDGIMSQIGSTGIYNFTFNQGTYGNWIVHLCSNHTSVITINNTIINEIRNINQSIINHGDSNWDTANGFATLQNATDIRGDIDSINTSLYDKIIETNLSIIGQGDVNWATADLSGLANVTAEDIWNYSKRNLTNWADIWNGTLVTNVWGASNRTLTELNWIIFTNWIVSQPYHWNYTNREITGGNLTDIYWANQSELYNGTLLQNWTSGSEYVWNYTNRSLTEDITASVNATEIWEYNVTNVNGAGRAGYVLRTILEVVEWIEKLVG